MMPNTIQDLLAHDVASMWRVTYTLGFSDFGAQ